MKKSLLTLLILLAFAQAATCQDFSYGHIAPAELNMKKYDKDTSAHAVVLQEFGRSKFDVVTGEDTRLIFEYHVKIKIFDNKGFDYGTIQIPVYHDTDNPDAYENVEEISGVTYYTDDKGAVKEIELENKKIYPVLENKRWSNYKFTMPGMRNGCVIEYKYKLISPYFDNLHPWHFQDYIPKIYSEYEVHVPAYWHYNFSLKGGLKLTKSSATFERDCYTAPGGSINGANGGASNANAVDCSLLVYGMSDIPAFLKEDFMTSSKNYLSAINSELIDYMSPYTMLRKNQTKEWKDIDLILKKSIYFGSQLKKTSLFKDRIVPVIAGMDNDLSKAKAVYLYIQKLFKWDGGDDFLSIDGLSNAITKHSGNAGEINMSLVVALNAAGLKAEPVLLSTRENGTINSLYPVINDFNYVIVNIDIAGQNYLLDATDPLLSFGMLPMRCLNGRGRIINPDGQSDWQDINPPQKQKTTRTLDFTLQPNGKLRGTFVRYSTGYDAYIKRIAIKKFNTIDEYTDDFNSKSPKIKVLKAEILNADTLDQPLIEKYDLEVDIADKLNGDRLAVNPFFWDRIDVNPFKLEDRSYPVDLGMPSDERLTFIIHLSDSYIVETPPQAIAIGMPNNGGKFITNYQQENNSLIFSHIIQLNNPTYRPDEYPYLKEFYNKIIQSEKGEIILKRK